MLEITPIPAFKDNYIWLLHRDGKAIVVDPGDADPVLHALARLDLKLAIILITHHHNDHIGGVAQLQAKWQPLTYAPIHFTYPFNHIAVSEGMTIHPDGFGMSLSVMDVPGHTLDHVAYYGANRLFCGDTLFGAGCGRLFEGTAQQLHASLMRLSRLPGETQVFCAHEYTEQNLSFAQQLEPGNAAIAERQAKVHALRLTGQPSLPSTIAEEQATNPFLRCHLSSVQQSAMRDNPSSAQPTDPEQVFATIREMRNHF